MPGDLVVALLSIAGALTIGAMSPGPSFVMVARTAVAVSRADGLAAALGMGVGGVLFAVLALLGLHVVLTAVPALYIAFKIAGGAYLVYLGWIMWRSARQPLGFEDAPLRPGRSFWLGLLTQLSNPKTALVYASVFVSLLPREVPVAGAVALVAVIFTIEAGWYALVAWALSARSPRAAYLRSKTWIDRAAGTVMAALGLKLIALR
jgi:threonine/homoserine/homoserine lactone efflux protein